MTTTQNTSDTDYTAEAENMMEFCRHGRDKDTAECRTCEDEIESTETVHGCTTCLKSWETCQAGHWSDNGKVWFESCCWNCGHQVS